MKHKAIRKLNKQVKEIDMLKHIISEQTEQIYKLYKRINELNEQISRRRNSEQQENIQKCNA